MDDADVRNGYFPWDERKTEECMQAVSSFYRENGYAVITKHANVTDVEGLRHAAMEIIKDFHDTSTEATCFSSQNTTGRLSHNTRFLESASKISCFLEEQQETVNNYGVPTAVNKIGHAMHDLNPIFSKFSRAPTVKRVAAAIGMEGAALVQSMYIVKGARVGGVVVPHRDATFLAPISCKSDDCLGLWWALQPATLQNGCLWVVPRSHNDERKIRRFVRKGNSLTFEGEPEVDYYDESAFVPLPVDVGDLIVLHGAVVHKSSHNYSDFSRHAYSIHLVKDRLSDDCWLQRPKDLPFRPL